MSPRTGFPEVSDAVKPRTKLHVQLHETTSVPEIPGSGLKPHGAAGDTESPAPHLVGAGPDLRLALGRGGNRGGLGGDEWCGNREKLGDVEGRPQE